MKLIYSYMQVKLEVGVDVIIFCYGVFCQHTHRWTEFVCVLFQADLSANDIEGMNAFYTL